MSGQSRDWSSELTITELVAPADTTDTATSAAIDTENMKRATVLFHFEGITGGGSWTVSLTSSDTSGGSYTAETSANVFTAGAPAALEDGDAGLVAYDLNLDRLESRYIKVVITKADTISASVLSAALIAEKQRV